ncbi:MAG: class I SAM-dependent methyltransferase [Bacteroidia bacterium]|jgi:SAM-dependent methyltransferase|nr:class I SAM-dependent methyltransferase [Bacteroidia bacterium]
MGSKIKNADGVRKLGLLDIAPNCEIEINKPIYSLAYLSKGKKVVDIGCGYGATRDVVIRAGGEWTGVEPFEGGGHSVVGDAQNLPFANESFDLAYMNAVLEHVPDPGKAFAQVARVLKKDGVFIGYVAFMECFHEISYCHLSFKALENFSIVNGMKLVKISGGHRFGIDYHKAVLFYPLSFKIFRSINALLIRSLFKFKSKLAYLALLLIRRKSSVEARHLSELYYKVECLRQSVGFYFYITKN